MIKGRIYRHEEIYRHAYLKVILQGYQTMAQVGGAIEFLCDKVIGIHEGVATDTGIFEEAKVICKGLRAFTLQASYRTVPYDLKIETSSTEIIFEATRMKTEKVNRIPDGLYEQVDKLLHRYLKQANRGGS